MSTLFDPNLDPELRATVEYCSDAMRVTMDAASKLNYNDESDAQLHALARISHSEGASDPVIE